MHDIKQAEALIAGFDFDKLLADKGYESNRFHDVIAAAGAEGVMSSNRACYHANPYDKIV